MNILFINNFFNSGGSTLASLELAKEFKKNYPDYEMKFVGCYHGNKIDDLAKLGEVYYGKGPFHNFDYHGQIIYKYKGDGTSHNIYTLMADFAPDIIHVFLPGQENPIYFKFLPKNIMKICTVLCCQEIGFDHTLFDHITFLSKYSQSLSPKVDNGIVINGGLENIQYPLRPPNNPLVFGRISAFCPSKYIEDTIACASECKDNLFIIAGEIQDYNYYKYIEKHSQNISNIRLLSNINEQQKLEILDKIDILHYPTSNESLCYSIIEALRIGKPIISYDNSSINEYGVSKGVWLITDQTIMNLVETTKDLGNYYLDQKTYIEHCRLNQFLFKNSYTSETYMKNMRELYPL